MREKRGEWVPWCHVGVSNVLGWVKRLRVKRVTGEKHVNPYTTRLING